MDLACILTFVVAFAVSLAGVLVMVRAAGQIGRAHV